MHRHCILSSKVGGYFVEQLVAFGCPANRTNVHLFLPGLMSLRNVFIGAVQKATQMTYVEIQNPDDQELDF